MKRQGRGLFSIIFSALCALSLGMPLLASAANHALLIAIRDYPPRGPNYPGDLDGTPADQERFRQLARANGVKDSNITILIDGQATKTNILANLERLAKVAGERDTVLIQYAGHGTQEYDPGSQKANQCSEGIVVVNDRYDDTEVIYDRVLRKHIDAISEKAGRVMVFFDSCHSGAALRTRAMGGGGDGQLRARFIQRAGASAEQCGRAVNARSVTPMARGLTEGKKNLVFFGAAAPNEVAWDAGPKDGGLATRSWMACWSDPAADTDGSGSISAKELWECSKKRLAEYSSDRGHNEPMQTLKIDGAAEMPLGFSDVQVAAAAPATATSTAVVPPPAVVSSAAGSAVASLNDLFNGRSHKWDVKFASSKPSYRIRKEQVELTLQSARSGYVYLLMVGTGDDAKGMTVIFPNELDKENRINAGETLSLPRAFKWRLTPGGPAGTDHLLAIVAEKPMDFSSAGATKVAIFQQTGGKRNDLAAAQRAVTRSLLVEQDDAGNAYGAALIKIQEVD